MSENIPVFVAIYVDDILIFTAAKHEEKRIVDELSTHVKMKDLGEASSVLGVKINRNRSFGTICLPQTRYIEGIIERLGLIDCNPVNTPVDVNQKLTAEMCATVEERESMGKIPYKECIGSLLFIAQISRPDISFGVNLLSRYCENPGKVHWIAAKRILWYLKGTKSLELIYSQTADD